jgi:alkanesulfonate monooxygenase SsuD/methylene tetrahydromethanopterin reductase-like flavin-dependent oxidoreductase (luciferase family)
VLEAAARSADGWNGWGLDLDGFAGRAARLAQLTRASGREPAEVATTWGGIALVGANAAELRSLEDARGSGGKTMEIWRGTVDDLRRFRDGVAASGATWLILALAGPADRLELIADALGTR